MRMFAICSVLGLATCAYAQDARSVAEPKIPVACVVLAAELAPHHGELSDAEERGHRDTARIEQAMANCMPGKAVVLRAGKGERTVFLIGPMKLHAGIATTRASSRRWQTARRARRLCCAQARATALCF